jgi:ankyrin repeat protein
MPHSRYVKMFRNINIAAACGNIKTVTYFLRQNPRAVHHRDRSADGCTPWFHAAWSGNIKLAKLLLDAGANVNQTDRSNETPLHGASGWREVRMVRFLLRHGARVNIRGAAGYYPLHWAVHSGNATVVRLLLEAGAKINMKNGSGDTPLEWALRYRRHRAASILREWQ